MKYTPHFPPEKPYKPFPPAAIQYTRCLLVLAVIRTFCEEIRPEASVLPAAVNKRLSQIQKRLAEVSETMGLPKGKPLSAAAKRELNGAFEIIADRCSVNDMMHGEADILKWYDAIYLAHLLIIDCVATCPAYYNSQSWSWLFHHLYCLAEYIDERNPGTADAAADIHMEITV